VYEVVLLDGEVTDAAGNAATEQALGVFEVAIPEPPPPHVLVVEASPPEWGVVSPPGGTFDHGAQVVLTAEPAPYQRFAEWQGDLAGGENPAALAMTTDRYVRAIFDHIYTTNGGVPHAWLAEQGFTNDFEEAATSTGSNGVPLWASYVAGLDPDNPTSVFAIAAAPLSEGALAWVVTWNAASGRLYTVLGGADAGESLSPLPGAVDLPWTRAAYTATLDAAEGGCLGVSVRVE
jgi:hypothetical protein